MTKRDKSKVISLAQRQGSEIGRHRRKPASLSQDGGSQQSGIAETQRKPFTFSEQILYSQFYEFIREVKQLKSELLHKIKSKPTIISEKIYSLPSDIYKLFSPIDIILKIYSDETLALIPELEIYGEGNNEFEAINDLKLELIDLLEELSEIPDEELGTGPKSWKKTLKMMVKDVNK